MGVHERHWWHRRPAAHQRQWHQRLEGIAHLEGLLASWSPTGDAARRRDAVTVRLTALRVALLQTPSRAGQLPRIMDIRHRM